MIAEIAVRGAQRVDEITRAGAQGFTNAEVVLENLARRRRYVLRAVEKVFDDALGERIETFVRVAASLHFRREVCFEESMGQV